MKGSKSFAGHRMMAGIAVAFALGYLVATVSPAAREGDDVFERRLAGVDADTRESILQNYAYRMGSPENQAGLLKRAERSPHGEAMALYPKKENGRVRGTPLSEAEGVGFGWW